jgi:WD40 repeat protein
VDVASWNARSAGRMASFIAGDFGEEGEAKGRPFHSLSSSSELLLRVPLSGVVKLENIGGTVWNTRMFIEGPTSERPDPRRYLLQARQDQLVIASDADTGEIISTIKHDGPAATCLAFQDRTGVVRLVSGAWGGEARIDAISGGMVQRTALQGPTVRPLPSV